LEKIIQTIENWQKQKKTVPTLKPVSKCDKVFFPTKKKDAFLKKITIFYFEKREFVKKNPLIFF
jgi:hypothetical protein